MFQYGVNHGEYMAQGIFVFQNEALLLSAVSSDSDILKKSLLAYRIHSESESMDWHLLVQLQDV